MTITALPTPPSRQDPVNFAAQGDAFLAALPTFAEEANALAIAMNLNSTTDGSTTSNTVSTGAKTFDVTAGKSFQPGMYLVIADSLAPTTNSMWGQITSYSGTSLVVNIRSYIGSGTKTSWVISQSAPGGASLDSQGRVVELANYALSGPGATPFTFRNKIINGNFAINQRGYVSGAATGIANQYTLDRWRVVTSGQNLAFTASGNGNAVTAPAGGLEQVIEGASIEGGIYTASWIGAGTVSVNGAAVTNGGQTSSLTAGANVTIKLVGAVSQFQFEIGPVATPFEQRPIGIELALCQRYYESASTNLIPTFCYSANNAFMSRIDFRVQKRVSPTMAFTAAGFSLVGYTSTGPTYADLAGFSFQFVTPTTTVPSIGYGSLTPWTASAEF
jgi:hypothetical protein